VRVHGVFAGPVDTDMTQSLEMTKACPESGARIDLFPFRTFLDPVTDDWYMT